MPGRMRDPSPTARGRRVGDGIEPAGRTTTDDRQAGARLDGPSGPYAGWTLVELRRRAAEVGVVGRSGMRKEELVRALESSSGSDDAGAGPARSRTGARPS